MESGQNARPDPIVAARPRGANGIPEVFEVGDDALAEDAPRQGGGAGGGMRISRTPSRLPYAEWIAVTALVGGAVAAIVGVSRELTSRSARRSSGPGYPQADGTKPHGDKLLPHGQNHW